MPDLVALVGALLAAIVGVISLSALPLRLWNTTVSDAFQPTGGHGLAGAQAALVAGILFGPPSAIGHTSDGQSAAASQLENES